jgi:hypothetical protein
MTLAGDLYTAIQGPAWDDVRAPATAIPLQGQSGDPDRDTDGSLLFDASSVEQTAIIFQMPHAWDGDGVRFHCHWQKTTDAAGDVIWQERHRVWNNNAIAPAWSEWAAATSRSQTIASDQTTLIDGFTEIATTGMRGSCMINIQLRRKADDAGDTYGADAKLWEADLHYKAYGLGSEQEYPQ